MMVWLAFNAWSSAGQLLATGIASRFSAQAFVTGALMNLRNPKAYVFFVVVTRRFPGGQLLSVGNAITLAAISTVIATVIHLAILLASARAGALLDDGRRMKLVRRLFTPVMLDVAASLLFAG